MPIGKRPQSAIFYALITFVGLFIITLVAGVVCYIKEEDYRTKTINLQSQTNELATPAELRKIGGLVGEKQRQKSRLGAMVDYLDEMAKLITGSVPEDASAEVKVDTAKQKVKDTLDSIAKGNFGIEVNDPNTTGLVQIAEKLKGKLENTTKVLSAAEGQYKDLQNRFDDAMAISRETEQALLVEKTKYQREVNDIQKSYNELKDLTKQTAEQQVKTLLSQLEGERAGAKELNQKLLKTEAELKMVQDKLRHSEEKLRALVPLPDSETAAFQPDARIILIDDNTKIVHLDIGSKDHVYQGLTFSVYDKNLPIPKDGKGKAEVEVFNVDKNICAARITRSDPKNPIIVNDVAANLIWDSKKANMFVVAGEFDLDSDGSIDYNAAEKIKGLIEKWGGKTEDSISVNTDFLILGNSPEVRSKPTFEQTEADPMAMEKYEESLQRLAHYQEIQSQAQALFVPVLNMERFLYFIGYKTQSGRPGAF